MNRQWQWEIVWRFSILTWWPLLLHTRTHTGLVPAHIHRCSLSHCTYMGRQLFVPTITLTREHRQFHSVHSVLSVANICSRATCKCSVAIRILGPSVLLITWLNFLISISILPMPVAAPFKEWVCRRSMWICIKVVFEDYLYINIAGGRLLGWRVRIPPGAWMYVPFECCVLSGRGLCDGPITGPVLPSVVCLSVITKLRTGRLTRHRVEALRKKKSSVIFPLKFSSL